jgi:hypothetical protein
VVRPGPWSDRDQTYRSDLMCDLPLASLLAKLIADWGVGPTSDPTSCHGWTRAVALRLGAEGTLIPWYRQWPLTPLQVMWGPVCGAKDSSGGIGLLEIKGCTLLLALEVGYSAT